MKDIDELPILDCELTKKLAGKKYDLVQDILALLIKELPNDLTVMNQLYQQKKYRELEQRLHQLHGALCYCGTPRLKTIVAQLESKLKNKTIDDDLTVFFNKLNSETTLLLQHYAAIKKMPLKYKLKRHYVKKLLII